MGLAKKEKTVLATALAVIAFCATVQCLKFKGCNAGDFIGFPGKVWSKDSIRVCTALPSDNGSLLPGYNYWLAEKFAGKMQIQPEISVICHSDTAIRILADKKTDILVLPLSDTSIAEDKCRYITVDSVCIWAMSENARALKKEVAGFVREYTHSDLYARTRFIFTRTYDPRRSGRRRLLSPYDSLLRKQADTIGIDWRMLAAVAYRESGFRIEAQSSRGARGLMQVMPEAGHNFGVDDLLNPALCIIAGGRIFKYLHNRFCSVKNDTVRMNMTLAAYNAGAGKVLISMEAAEKQGEEDADWNAITSYLPGETVAFVNGVNLFYNEFCRICPEQ